MSAQPLLSVRDLRISYTSRGVTREVVHGVSLDIAPGEVVAIVGESGSGKTTVAQSLIGMLSHNGRISGGTVMFDDMDIARFSDRAWRNLRGDAIGLVPQDPTVSLNPVMKIGPQVSEPLRVHRGLSRKDAEREAIRILAESGLTNPKARAEQYPHQLSGGMRQRVLIGMALACTPRLVVADEPTSALDVTVQRQILDHIDGMIAAHGTAMLLITHDLAVAADRAQRIVVMCKGEIVEEGPAVDIMAAPRHPYTKKLLAAAPSLSTPSVKAAPAPAADGVDDRVIRLDRVTKQFHLPAGGVLTAVDDVSLDIRRGETLGLVGESGSGKSTLARIVLQLEKQTSGEVYIDGAPTSELTPSKVRWLRRRMQVVYQNPYASLDPRFTVASIIDEPLRAFRVGDRRQRRARVLELLDRVSLPAETARRRAEELSGGMRQRVAIARALALSPELLVCDEPTSALDVSVQAQVLDLLTELQRDLGVTILFISHDLAVVRQISHRVAVMQFGVLRECGDAEQVFTAPADSYTRELLTSIPGRELVA
ncbi:dipeptide ABC transporter ATP-binding protein [Microbacterium sp. CPCC 204701]|uniref:dipeptide ABC transporter ATP-binding protein n=1 Tax=Microbacterium sp. CPCC 204701 TaxID=2493084 RepID=UPI001F0CBA35|nr:ABC transporter ATP-binding protein [Microbacterium sp. CPCC 204701]